MHPCFAAEQPLFTRVGAVFSHSSRSPNLLRKGLEWQTVLRAASLHMSATALTYRQTRIDLSVKFPIDAGSRRCILSIHAFAVAHVGPGRYCELVDLLIAPCNKFVRVSEKRFDA